VKDTYLPSICNDAQPIVTGRDSPLTIGTPTPAGAVQLPKHVWLSQYRQSNEALSWANGGEELPPWGIGGCAAAHPFYTRYTLALAHGVGLREGGIPVLASSDPKLPDAALLRAAEILVEQTRQLDSRMAALGIAGARQTLVSHRVRYAMFSNAERRNDTCALCLALDPTWDCNAHIDSRGGRVRLQRLKETGRSCGGGVSALLTGRARFHILRTYHSTGHVPPPGGAALPRGREIPDDNL
jgi:hypothetical protein